MADGHGGRKQLYAILACDLAVIYLSLALALWASVKAGILGEVTKGANIGIFAFIGLYFIFVFKSVGLYKEKTGILHIKETISIFRGILSGFLFVFLIFFLIPGFGGLHKALLFFFVFMMCFMPQERLLLRKWIQSLHERGIGVTRTLIIGTGIVSQRLASKLYLMPKIGFKPVGILAATPEEFKKASRRRIPVLGDISLLPEAVEKKDIGAVFLAEQNLPYEQVLNVMNFCAGKKTLFRFVPYIYNMPIDLIAMDDIEGIPVIGLRKYNPRSFYAKVKRSVDIIVSLAAVIILFAPMLLIAAAVKLGSPGKALFSQKRIGQKGKPFNILKFRTMFAGTSKYTYTPKSSNDPRITRTGYFLRRTGMDELPQFINILKGDMSLVGPRPEMEFIVKEYNDIQKERLKVRPGITGLWQISEHRKSPIHENMEYDLFYIENQSFLLDLAILLRTFFSVFGQKGK
ncbi:MAG: sugar transferase [Candidatus Omnitrophota bacterium]|nr:sugar transferase [Candidatus Omnitrophota bacterium]